MAVKEVLDRIAGGEDVQTVLPDFKQALRTQDEDRPEGDLTFEQKEERALSGTPDATDTFTQVKAYWIMGRISDEQYSELRQAALQGIRTVDGDSESEAPSNEDEEDAEEPENPET